MQDRAGGGAPGRWRGGGGGRAAANGNPDEGVGGGEQDLVRLRPGVLEDDALTVNALRLAARQVERGSVLVPDDHVGSDGRDLQVVGGADARQGCGRGVRQRAALQQRRHAPSLGGHRVHVALQVHGRDCAGHVRNTGVRIVRVDGRGVVSLLRPHLAVGRVCDRDRAAAHVRGHSPVVHCRRQGGRCDVNGSQRIGHLIGELDLLAVLEDVEGGGGCVQSRVHEAGGNVHMCDDAALCVGDPHAAVVEVDLGFFDAGGDECQHDRTDSEGCDRAGEDRFLGASNTHTETPRATR